MNQGTPNDLLRLLAGEIENQSESAMRSGRALLAAPTSAAAWSLAHLFAHSAATVAAMFWPPDTRRKRLAQAFPSRGEDMRRLFALADEAWPGIKELRNAFAHIDERYEEFWLDSPTHNLVVRHTGPPEAIYMDGAAWFHGFDPSRGNLTFLGATVNVPEVIEAMEWIHEKSGEIQDRLWREVVERNAPQAAG